MARALTHKQIWTAIDALATEHGMSASGLAKASGLDPTTFNKSKRVAVNGKERWPSTESVAKVLAATNASIDEFVALIGPKRQPKPRLIPLVGFAQAGKSGYFDDAGFPAGSGWDEIAFPDIGDEQAYVLEISGDSMQPVYRDGDRIVVSPNSNPRRGDRVVLKTNGGEVMAKHLIRSSSQRVELRSFNPEYDDRVLPTSDIDFIHRIVWASQ